MIVVHSKIFSSNSVMSLEPVMTNFILSLTDKTFTDHYFTVVFSGLGIPRSGKLVTYNEFINKGTMSLGRLQLQFTSKDFLQECAEFTRA